MIWYKKGWGGVPKEDDDKLPSRFFLLPGKDADVIFLEDEPFGFWEHELWLYEQRVYYTCIKGLDTKCPLCEENVSKRYYAGAFTILDLTRWTDHSGKQHDVTKRLLIAKQKFLNKLKKQREKRGNLVGCKFNLSRSDENAPRTGDNIEFIEKVDISSYPEVLTKPFDYIKMFEPRKVEFLEGVVKEIKTEIFSNYQEGKEEEPY